MKVMVMAILAPEWADVDDAEDLMVTHSTRPLEAMGCTIQYANVESYDLHDPYGFIEKLDDLVLDTCDE